MNAEAHSCVLHLATLISCVTSVKLLTLSDSLSAQPVK